MADEIKKGRPSLFTNVIKDCMLRMYEKGMTDSEVAEIIGVSQQTIDNWKKKDQDFFGSLKEAKEMADQVVEVSLLNRAIGYSHKTEKIFLNKKDEIVRAETIQHYAPDVTAQIFWLKNRKPKEWREKQEIEMSGNPIQIKIEKDDTEL